MIILGIDPSLYSTGWALLDCSPGGCRVIEAGTIKIKRRATPKGRAKRHNVAELGMLHHELTHLAEWCQYPKKVDCFALEYPINLPGAQTAVLWMVQGVARGCLGGAGLTGECYDPATVKKAVTGNRSAEKHVVERFVQAQLSEPYKFGSDDASDAAAIALTHWRRHQTNQLLLPAMQKQKTSRKRRRVKC